MHGGGFPVATQFSRTELPTGCSRKRLRIFVGWLKRGFTVDTIQFKSVQFTLVPSSFILISSVQFNLFQVFPNQFN